MLKTIEEVRDPNTIELTDEEYALLTDDAFDAVLAWNDREVDTFLSDMDEVLGIAPGTELGRGY